MQFLTRNLDHSVRKLVVAFFWWKTLLLLIALCSPGPGYDTSGSLIEASHGKEILPLALRHTIGKLVRWDAIYFVKTAERGYLFEQEWAFGWGFSRVIAHCTEFLKFVGIPRYQGLEAFVASCIAHIGHLLSVILVFNLSLAVFPSSPRSFAFTAAFLHVVSPAGLFLSAPYAESSCAALSFAGSLLFVKSLNRNGQSSTFHDMYLVLSGVLFGVATTFRSNGILSGLLLLEEAFKTLFRFGQERNIATLRRLIAAGLGGLFVGSGFLLPQYIAYQEYCGSGETIPRIWCQRTVPSIYSFVQSHYWNCGPFQYWTVSNIPLFILGTPMFAILIASGLWALRYTPTKQHVLAELSGVKGRQPLLEKMEISIIRNMAVQQLFLVTMTLTTAHVQIITRISSAYPVWLWYLAESVREGRLVGIFVKFMVLYSMIQAGLYASFLPPA